MWKNAKKKEFRGAEPGTKGKDGTEPWGSGAENSSTVLWGWTAAVTWHTRQGKVHRADWKCKTAGKADVSGFNYISGSGSWIHLEFESDSITKEDLRRFREYEAATSRSFNVAVVTYVICTSGVKQLLSKLTEGINSYQVKVIRLKNRNRSSFWAAEKEEKLWVNLWQKKILLRCFWLHWCREAWILRSGLQRASLWSRKPEPLCRNWKWKNAGSSLCPGW